MLDVWIDSGVAGWASLYYPEEKDKFEDWFPYDFITEGHDQTRGWFYSQLGTGVISMGKSPYQKVLMHGFVLDENGNKMSKSLGNVVSPEEVIEKYGADVLRFYLLWASKPWDDLTSTRCSTSYGTFMYFQQLTCHWITSIRLD